MPSVVRQKWTLCAGNYSKASRQLGWRPEVSFENLFEIMMKSDLEGLSAQHPER
jgi:GDP-D-mannose dehydratase